MSICAIWRLPVGLKKLILVICLFGVFSVQFVIAQDTDFKFLQGLGDTRYHCIESQLVEQVYHVYVRLPEGYQKTQKYPVVYLLDGGWTYPILAGYYQYLRSAEEIPSAIIVGISYGTDDWQKGNARSRDYTAPSPERSYWGGAGNFQEVLRNDIFSMIESQYTVNPERRILFGQSLGGQFVLFTALTAPDLCYGYIASNPALHRNLDFFLSFKLGDFADRESELPVLFVSSGSEDDARFRKPAFTWMQHWSSQTNIPWRLKTTTLTGHSHFSAVPEAFRQGMRWIFNRESKHQK